MIYNSGGVLLASPFHYKEGGELVAKISAKPLIRSQLSGKLSAEDTGLFALKKKLLEAGIEVQFPFGDRIIGEYKGIPVTFAPNRKRSFYDVELAFFQAIRNNPVHIVHNRYGRNRGYIGKSASMEIAYAILHHRPIIMLYRPVCSESVQAPVKKLIKANFRRFVIKRIDLLGTEALHACISDVIADFRQQYDLCDVATEIGVMDSIADLFESYRSQ